ncbi:MAG: MbcA/ParS/Xre antitoxin family protein [Candidatus Puniceispirillaceae bacterium]
MIPSTSELYRAGPDLRKVLTKATFRVAQQLGLNQTELGAVLGMDRSSVSRLKTNAGLDPQTKEGELALLLFRLGRELSSLTDADPAWIQHFMRTANKETNGVPAEQIKTIIGLVSVLRFVDAIRAKI